MAICLNNNHLLIGHQNLIILNINSQESKEINLEHKHLMNQEEKKCLGIKEESFIENISYNKDSHQYLITTDNKGVFILNDNFEIVRTFLAKRAISKAVFDRENNVLIADKTGDVYIYKIDGDPECLLGHLSMLLDIKMSSNGKFIVTSDRDEKIRVSKYPNAYNVECFCLGHSEHVSNIELWRDLVISGSGDGTVRVWSIESGKQKAIANTNDYIDSNGILEGFKKNMAEDDMFVSSLPITSLQIVQLTAERVIVTASIHMFSKLQIYYLDYLCNGDVRLIYTESIDFTGDLIDFYSSLNSLYILTRQTLYLYILKDEHFVIIESCNYIDRFIATYQTIFNKLKCKDVKVLYKKTFDNVQDYLDRKKMRIDLKNQ